MPKLALLVGRFHALTRAQADWILSLARDQEVERLVCAVTSADHVGTRRNPLDAATREAMLEPALAAAGKPFRLVRVNDIPDDAAWPAHVARVVGEATGWPVTPETAEVYTANRAVEALFARDGYRVARAEVALRACAARSRTGTRPRPATRARAAFRPGPTSGSTRTRATTASGKTSARGERRASRARRNSFG